jgi:hypothetical protein
VNTVTAAIVFAALLTVAPSASAARIFAGEAPANAGKSFLEHLTSPYAEEPFHSLPSFAGPLAKQPREPEGYALLLASLGLMVYLGRRREKALAAWL